MLQHSFETIFQLAFSFAVGPTMMKITASMLQRGIQLETLERFAASWTVFSVFKAQGSLGSFNFLAIICSLFGTLRG
jgi:hypothetical protein